jgi:hypothetical protein
MEMKETINVNPGKFDGDGSRVAAADFSLNHNAHFVTGSA